MKKTTTSQLALAGQNDRRGAVAGAWEVVGLRFDQFCLLAGVLALNEMFESDASNLAGVTMRNTGPLRPAPYGKF
jgi:hypothetical protein